MQSCPTPNKTRYASRVGARVATPYGATLSPYRCVCGWWHLTKRRIDDRADPQVVEVLREATPDQFRALVAEELAGHATPEEEAALRSEELVIPWGHALNAIAATYQRQLEEAVGKTDRTTVAWRKKQQARIQTLALRRQEQKDLARQYRQRQEVKRKDRKPQRPGPRAIAIDKLIKAHPEEFARLVQEAQAELETETAVQLERGDE